MNLTFIYLYLVSLYLYLYVYRFNTTVFGKDSTCIATVLFCMQTRLTIVLFCIFRISLLVRLRWGTTISFSLFNIQRNIIFQIDYTWDRLFKLFPKWINQPLKPYRRTFLGNKRGCHKITNSIASKLRVSSSSQFIFTAKRLLELFPSKQRLR